MIKLITAFIASIVMLVTSAFTGSPHIADNWLDAVEVSIPAIPAYEHPIASSIKKAVDSKK